MVYQKNPYFLGGFTKKTSIEGRGGGCGFNGGLERKKGVVFLKGGVDTQMHTMVQTDTLLFICHLSLLKI